MCIRDRWMIAAAVLTFPRFKDEWSARKTYHAPPPPVPQAEIDFVRAHTGPTDRIFTLGDPLLYVYSNRRTAFREGIVLDELIPYYPGDTDQNRLAGQKAALLAKRPKLVVFGNDLVDYKRKQRYIEAPVSYTHLRAHETPEHLVC